MIDAAEQLGVTEIQTRLPKNFALVAVLERQLSNFLAKLKAITVVIPNGELAHTVVEVLDRVDHSSFLFQSLPPNVYIFGMKIERTRENRFFQWFMLIRKGQHEFDFIFPQAGPFFELIFGSEAQNATVKLTEASRSWTRSMGTS
jgi:hypothetical protein